MTLTVNRAGSLSARYKQNYCAHTGPQMASDSAQNVRLPDMCCMGLSLSFWLPKGAAGCTVA